MNFKAETLAYRVILKPLIERISKGGIHLPTDPRWQAVNTDKGEVLLIGPSCWDRLERKPELKAGDKVYYARWGAKLLRNDEQPDPEAEDAFYIICNDEDILVGYDNE